MDCISLVKERLQTMCWEGVTLEDCFEAPEAPSFLEDKLIPGDLPDTLCWPDIDYADHSRAVWKPSQHYHRLCRILYEHGRDGLKDETFREKILRALAYFVEHDFQSDNWWYNQIGTPRHLSDLALMLDGYLPEKLFTGLITIIGRGSITADILADDMTGANCLWFCSITLRLAVLTKDEELMRLARDRAAQEMIFAPEGVQPDGSFFQHGPRLYSGGYGRAYVYDTAQFVYAFGGTALSIGEEQMNVLLTHVLDGLRYMTKGHILDYQCLGRQYTRKGEADVGFLRKGVSLLAKAEGLPRREELCAYQDTILHDAPFAGTRYYPRAAFLAHHTGSLYVGAKFLWGNLYDEEICNDEGILGYNLSYGTHHCAMVTGQEYFDIAPVWRYDHIPGTTARRETDEALLAHKDWQFRQLSEGGGDQKGDLAVIWEKMCHETVSALVADFAFPGGFVSLNAEILDGEGQPLHTTLEQCFSAGDPEFENGAVVHHGIRYRALDGSVLAPHVRTVTGSWKRSNPARLDAPVTASLFTLTVEHPAGQGSCAYLLSPADWREPEVTLLCNDTSVQAIMLSDGRVMAVFHERGSLALPDGRVIEGDKGVWIG